MRELDHHPEAESRYSCDLCSDSGLHNETREYCACPLGLQRCNTDKVAEMLRGAPFTDAMWTMQQATAKAERAIAAADKVLLIDRTQRAEAAKLNAEGRAFEMAQKLEQVERELAEVRKDAERYRFLRTRDVNFEGADEEGVFVSYIPELGHDGSRLDQEVDCVAASVAQAKKEQSNG